MKNLLIAPKTKSRILGIDPSSQKVAGCLVTHGNPVVTFRIDLGSGEIFSRIYLARKYFSSVLEMMQPDFVCIEQSIMVQNPDTMRKMSYVVGTLMGEVLIRGIDLEDVPPMSWKSFLGAKPVTAGRKRALIDTLGETEARKEIQRLKKGQVQDILNKSHPYFSPTWEDHDIADAAGIALWAWNKHGVEDL